MIAVEARNLRKTYKTAFIKTIFPPKRELKVVEALKGINLDVRKGEIFGLLGPNGAGKTTTIRILAGLLVPDGGYAKVLGYDVVKDANKVRSIVGLVSGANTRLLYNKLTGIENLVFFATLYGINKKIALKRAKELLKVVGLEKWGDSLVENYSTGMAQKLAIAKGLIHDPKVLLLDEPTLGLDPGAAKEIRNFIKNKLRDELGKTVLLTTHYMQEAEELADRVAIIKDGKIIAQGKPDQLKRSIKEEIIELIVSNCYADPKEILANSGLSINATVELLDPTIGKWRIRFVDGDNTVGEVIRTILRHDKIKINELRTDEPTLEDAFLVLTNKIQEVKVYV
ncbi:MAG: ATP-binding cassette domain-containing protein [Candidatus Njordarchaeia archaeon]